ncbi:MAG: hypothetical protein A2X34_05345 [Elusimicrobia bacterium GWC2_51_8]|nr:MAG: hypothetical protein A2X33_09110 [Elusimicrobia bacterium GWA2_51_34]OGR65437.1 MAG: hypothetical protein A2X34_05345 [Elusimicrobia bacterium GWC2_51_8]HCE97139.1 hypothetical protein [Elusimicrobiota bacterium]
MFAAIRAFFSKWFSRLRSFAMIAGAWGVLFSVITLISFKVGFEYDDGLVFSTPAFKAASAAPVVTKSGKADADYWNAINRAYKLEHIKPIPWLTAWFFKIFGFKVEIFCTRDAAGSESLQNSWRVLADYFHFIADENKKYELLEQSRFIFYFTPSDEGVIQAKKADVTPIRIYKNKKSLNTCLYNPGKFGERMLPLSEF